MACFEGVGAVSGPDNVKFAGKPVLNPFNGAVKWPRKAKPDLVRAGLWQKGKKLPYAVKLATLLSSIANSDFEVLRSSRLALKARLVSEGLSVA